MQRTRRILRHEQWNAGSDKHILSMVEVKQDRVELSSIFAMAKARSRQRVSFLGVRGRSGRDDEIGRQIVGAMRREIEPAHGAAIVDLQKSTEQLAFAAARTTAAKPALQGGPEIAFFDRAADARPYQFRPDATPAADSSSRQIRGRLRAGPTISGQHAGATYACSSLVIVVSGTPAKLLANR
jgi:hypothetical protein